MAKTKTKREVVIELIEKNIEDVYKMEVVRDANKHRLENDPKDSEAKTQMNAAVKQIMKNQENITFLKEYIKTCV